MAIISRLARLVAGVERGVDLSVNTLAVGALQINGTGGNVTQNPAAGTTTSYSVFWPAAQATGTQFLQNDGSGNLTWVTATTGANTALSNLAAVAINTSLLPGADNSINLGSAAKSWASANIHTLVDASSAISVDVYNRALEDSAAATQLSWSTSGVEFNQLTATTVPYLNGSKILTSSAVTPTQLGYLSGATGTTGSGNLVYSASPTFTGTVTTAALSSTTGSFSGAVNMNSNKITSLADPTSAQDAATKNYVDTLSQGIAWKNPVRAVSTTNITLSAPQTVDGVSLLAGDRVLVAGQTTTANNGIYVVAAGAWTRATDASTGTELVAAAVFVDEGTTNASTAWVQTTAAPITIGTTAIAFSKFASATPYNFRNGLTQTGQIVDVVAGDNSLSSTAGSLVVKLNAAGAITTTGTGLQVNTDGSTTQITSNNVAVKLDTGATTGNIVSSGSGLKNTLEASNPTLQITSNALGVKLDGAGAIVTGAAGIKVAVDGSSIEISSDALRIKTTAYDQVTITGGGGSAAAVASAPALTKVMVAGQSFTANTTYAVRLGLNSNSETTGRVYAADYDTTSLDKFWVIGMFNSGSAISAGQNITVVLQGTLTLASADTGFVTGDAGNPAWLTAAGAFSTTAPSAALQAAFKLGTVQSTGSGTASSILVNGQMLGVN